MFLGTTLPVFDLGSSVNKVMIGPFVIEYIDGRKRGVGADSLDNFQNHLKLMDFLPRCVLIVWRHGSFLPRCNLSLGPPAFDPPRRKSNKDAAVGIERYFGACMCTHTSHQLFCFGLFGLRLSYSHGLSSTKYRAPVELWLHF